MGYGDKTWCTFNECVKFDKCGRAFTEKERQKAKKQWGSDDYIYSAFVNKPECFKDKKDD